MILRNRKLDRLIATNLIY